jgi:hypothetical protein
VENLILYIGLAVLILLGAAILTVQVKKSSGARRLLRAEAGQE